MELQYIYDQLFNKLTDRFYSKSSWPEPEIVSHLVSDDQVFLTLYRELYYRHIYSKLAPTIEHRFQSYENYCDLFNYILNSEGPVPLELPDTWLWDIIDEFIYQYQAFCVYRNKSGKPDNEIELLKNNPQVWSTYSVLNVLYSLIQKSSINEHLAAAKSNTDITETLDEYGARNLYKMLGFFSIVGLLRVHCMLGNYTMALKMLDNVDISRKSSFFRVTGCHVTVYYYIGFCYLMMRRYSDAINSFTHILSFMSRTKSYHSKSYQFDQMNKKVDQMYALLAISTSLFHTRLEDNLHSSLREKYSEHISRMRTGEDDLATYEELFLYASPKFISPLFSDLDDANRNQANPTQQQLNVFLGEVRHQLLMPTLQSYLGLYTSLSIPKLASFLNVDAEEVRRQLIILKLKSRQKKHSAGKNLIEGEYGHATDLDFSINGDMITVTQQKVARRYHDWYIRNAVKFDDMVYNMTRHREAIKKA
ncbi:hypothetical protein DSO57_1025673 [Entomophthora muscae]|uniref:Uncharacterized protein n=1 Tax=Entomophthora muscae TaxID=34485 RepID=A0ACC2T2G9_9FUNG|nr:hypothetical protein DSO57_1025673 [Entomophthora muscae]